jgi:hypothetical protein
VGGSAELCTVPSSETYINRYVETQPVIGRRSLIGRKQYKLKFTLLLSLLTKL